MEPATDPLRRLDELGHRLPSVSPPKGVYLPAVRSGRHVHVSGQVPMTDGDVVDKGKVGAAISPERAVALSRQCALAALAAIDAEVGLRQVERVVKVVGYVASAPGFHGQPAVLNGASELLVAVFGERGRHARTAVGVAELPLDAPVEVEITVEVTDRGIAAGQAPTAM